MLIERIKKTVEKFKLLKRGDKIVIALSGGPDSTALLFALNALKKEYHIKLHIAHLDHMLRGEREAKKDCDYVLNLANRLKLPFSLGKADVSKYAKDKGLSLEEAARELRYEFLLNVAKDVGANKIALGHTSDDQAETILMRLIRGTGLSGLRGIPPMRGIDGKFIVRPLIEVWRKDIETYLRGLKIKPRQDMTNLMPKFFRNRIRHELIPYLKKYNPNIKEVLARTARNFSYDYEILEGLVDVVFKRCVVVKADTVKIRTRDLKTWPIGLRRQILRKAIEALKGNLRRIDYSHIEDIEGLIESKRGALDLPDRIKAQRRKDSIVFYKLKDRITKLKIYRELSLPGKTFIPELNLLFDAKFVNPILAYKRCVKGKVKFPARRIGGSGSGEKKSKRLEYLDHDKLKPPLYVRTWEKGDRFKPLGMSCEKKLQDFFVDEKVPRGLRGSIPLIVSGKKIIWVCGLRLSEDVKINASTKRVLKISFKKVLAGQ